jgi:hypothetical protein
MVRVSHSASLVDYRRALTAPGARGPVLASALARMPIAMVGIATLLYVQRATGSFASAGLVSAGLLAGVAVGSVAQGRLVDRLGPTRPLLTVIGLFILAVGLLVLAVERGAATATLVPLAVLTGLSEPMVGTASRALWGRLLPEGPTRQAAYAYEAISMEVFFRTGEQTRVDACGQRLAAWRVTFNGEFQRPGVREFTFRGEFAVATQYGGIIVFEHVDVPCPATDDQGRCLPALPHGPRREDTRGA